MRVFTIRCVYFIDILIHEGINVCIKEIVSLTMVHEEDTSTGHQFAQTHGILLSIVTFALHRNEPSKTTIF